MEAKLVPAAGFRVRLLPGRGLRRGAPLANVVSIAGLGLAFLEALLIVVRERPRVVVMVGGYAGVASSLAAILLGIPVVVVNVDAEVGRANRLIGRFATASAVSGDESGLPRATVTGPPVRQAVLDANRTEDGRQAARSRLGIPEGRRVLAVVGGSLGARRLNEAAFELRAALSGREDLTLYHVAGARNEPEVRAAAASAPPTNGLDYRLVAFEPELPALLALADLVLSRAGAMTVAELAVISTPSVLVPLPGAPGDHQSVNARRLSELGAAVMLADDDATGEPLVSLVTTLIDDEVSLDKMSAAVKSLARPEAAAEIAGLVVAAMKSKARSRGRAPSRREV
jgi:UDP-N-acetylglucosamine--N-acetylmuramyl-(pentapeptide) pyrophosphoryl-undecaprenol N-acetylglucosamine transferase